MKNRTIAKLFRLNTIAMFLHLAQGIGMLALVAGLGTSKTYDISALHLTFDPATRSLVPASNVIFGVNFAWLVASFLFMSALAHFIIITVYRRRYADELKDGINRARWIEYSISASTMMVAIGLLSGMQDAASLVMMFGLVAVMNLTGLVMELVNRGRKETSWSSFWVGCIAGIVPWLAFGVYVWAAQNYSTQGVPGFVYGIYASIFLFFNCFAVNMYLQYKGIGKWRDYLFGERVYIWLSLIAKSALAWQVFGGVFQP